MKFVCEKALLVSAISVASRTVAQKSAIAALAGIHVKAGMKLQLSGYNLGNRNHGFHSRRHLRARRMHHAGPPVL